MKVEVQIINAFVEGKKGGNPAGVVLDADLLSREQRLRIAQQVGLSETAFISSSANADFKLDFYTPTRQIAHCGHATIATFSYLRQIGRLTKAQAYKETIEGNRQIILRGELAYMEQNKPSYQNLTPEEQNKVMESIGISPDDLLPGKQPMLVNTGNSFILVPVLNKEVLQHLHPQLKLIEDISEYKDLIGLYPFTLETAKEGRDASTRMFAPRYGIEEEAATGMAAGPLACYLHDLLAIKKVSYNIEQGYYMTPPSPSLIRVELEVQTGYISRLLVGGQGIASKKLFLDI